MSLNRFLFRLVNFGFLGGIGLDLPGKIPEVNSEDEDEDIDDLVEKMKEERKEKKKKKRRKKKKLQQDDISSICVSEALE